MIYRFEDFELREQDFCLTHAGQRVALEPKALSVLLVLLERAGRLVEKKTLLDLVWAGTFVEENTLTRTIVLLRRELGDTIKEPRLIETIHKRGYRFIAPVEAIAEESLLTPPAPEAPPPAPEETILAETRGRARTPILAAVAALLVIAVAAWTLRPKPLPPVSVPMPLTTYQGSEMRPSFSPDGNQVAFQWDGEKQDNFDIYVKGLGPDAAPLRLTTDPASDEWPAWSPDGRTIAFQRIISATRSNLMLIPALGGPERKLAELTAVGDSGGFGPTWSPDSKWIIVPSQAGEHMALFRVSVETGEMTQITHPKDDLDDVFPAISNDGTMLLYSHRPSFFYAGDIYTVRLDQNEMPIEAPHVIPPANRGSGVATWTPDGTEILVRRHDGYIRIPAAGSEDPQPIPWLSTDVRGVDLSRHGNRLAYQVTRGDSNIWRLDLTAKTPVPQRIIASTFRDVYPQYSPDGTRIVLESGRTGDHAQIWITNADGSQPRQLTFTKGGLAGTPHWSPDGRVIEYDSNEEKTYQIFTISPDGGKPAQLTQGAYDNYDAIWSRDGRFLYFASTRTGRHEVWKMPTAGGPAIQITHNQGIKAIESEDGKTLYFSKDSGEGSIWKMPVNGGPEEQIANSLHRDNFAVTARGIYYMTSAGDDGTSLLKFYNSATGATTTVLPMGRPEYGLDVSHDGRYLIYAQLDDPASDLMLVENFR